MLHSRRKPGLGFSICIVGIIRGKTAARMIYESDKEKLLL